METQVLGRQASSGDAPTERESTRPRRRSVAIAAVAAGLGLVLMTVLAPWPRSLSSEVTGDPELAEAAATVIDPGVRRNLSVTRISDGEVTHAGFGVDEHREFEAGSITKTFTTALFVDAIERGELEATTTLGEIYPEVSGDAASITMEELASHRSGLSPIVLNDPGLVWSATWRNVLRLDPYARVTTEGMINGLSAESLDTRGTVVYSNYGMSLLGQSLAEVTGVPYAELLQGRILTPLGMTETYLPGSRDGLRDDAPRGLSVRGLPAGPWTMGDSSPAGGVRSNAADLTKFLQAVMDGTAPGMAAITPRFEADPEGNTEIGYAWFTTRPDGKTIHWHNGITAGFTSFMGFDPDSGEGVIVLNDTGDVVDQAGIGLLTEGA